VLPSIKVDADSRNIEELEWRPDPDRFTGPAISGRSKALAYEKGAQVQGLRGHDARNGRGHLVIDDISQYETES
jgi:nitrogenase molybdenum-iron protein alpha chain